MADQPPQQAPESGITIDVSKKTVAMTGRDSLIAFMLILLIGSWAYIAHFRMDTVDKVHAEFAKSLSDTTATFLKVEGERSRQIEDLLRLTQTQTASLEIIAARVGSYMRPMEEYQPQQYKPRHTPQTLKRLD